MVEHTKKKRKTRQTREGLSSAYAKKKEETRTPWTFVRVIKRKEKKKHRPLSRAFFPPSCHFFLILSRSRLEPHYFLLTMRNSSLDEERDIFSSSDEEKKRTHVRFSRSNDEKKTKKICFVIDHYC